jgi:hypothetical protein
MLFWRTRPNRGNLLILELSSWAILSGRSKTKNHRRRGRNTIRRGRSNRRRGERNSRRIVSTKRVRKAPFWNLAVKKERSQFR